MSEVKLKFLVAGMVTCVEFQRSRFYTERLYKSRPNQYGKPDIRPMLNVSWCQYLTKIRRKIGGKIWTLKKKCVVFLNGEYLGDDEDLFAYILDHARLRIGVDFYDMSMKQLKDMLSKDLMNGKKFAYFTLAVDGISIGSMLFVLYNDVVPNTTKLFLRRCKSKNHGWRNQTIHRIVKDCWIQGGEFNLKHKHMPCENYVIPHDRRGVLSMCNSSKHSKNSVQYIISLNPTPWMDYKYVAFGQLVQGEEILRKIEKIETRYQAPKKEIKVVLCGEYQIELETDPADIKAVSKYYENVDEEDGLPKDVTAPYDVGSELSVSKYEEGDYCMDTDLKSNVGNVRLPAHLYELYVEFIRDNEGEEDIEEMKPHTSRLIPITHCPGYKFSTKEFRQQQLDIITENREESMDEVHMEVVQKVIEFDVLPPKVIAPHLTSSEKLDHEEIKTMFV